MTETEPQWQFTWSPPNIRILFKGLPGVWHHQHQLFFSWLIVIQIVNPGGPDSDRLVSKIYNEN